MKNIQLASNAIGMATGLRFEKGGKAKFEFRSLDVLEIITALVENGIVSSEDSINTAMTKISEQNFSLTGFLMLGAYEVNFVCVPRIFEASEE